MQENIIHMWMNQARPYFKNLCGSWYMYLHLCLMTFSTIVFLFDNNIYHLLILMNVIFLDGFGCIIVSDCPLSVLEEKYMNTCIVAERIKSYNSSGIMYNCDHKYECTLELLINIFTLLAIKIVMLIAMQVFGINFHSSTLLYPSFYGNTPSMDS